MMSKASTQNRVWLLPGLSWLIVFQVVPLLVVLGLSFLTSSADGVVSLPFTTEHYHRLLGWSEEGFDPLFVLIFLRSFILALGSTALCALCAFPVAFFISGLPKRRKTWALIILMIPFWSNLLVRTYAWQIILSPQSWVTYLAQVTGVISPSESLYPGMLAVYLGIVCDFLPYFALPLFASVEKIDYRHVDAAKDLGAGPVAAFRYALLPQLKPGLAAGVGLVFIPALGQYLIPDLLGSSKTYLVGNLVAQQFGPARNWPFGAAVAALLIILVLVLGLSLKLIQRAYERWGIC